ncbi:MAG: hypothetical protein V1743_05260 [Nanoarchaeota archaeon]
MEKTTHRKKILQNTQKKEQKKSSPLNSTNLTFIIGIAVIILAAGIIAYNQQQISSTLKEIGGESQASLNAKGSEAISPGKNYGDKYGTVKLDFYVMSQCPYGTQVEDAIYPVLKKLGDSVQFNLNFIANENATTGSFESLHGEPEVKGDIAQLCAMKYNPAAYMDMIVCQNKNAAGIPGNWESCAKDNGLDVEKIKACYTGDEGKTLLSVSIQKSDAISATGSPTIYINDQPYQSGRDSLSFQRAICANLPGHPECKDLPACAADTDCIAEPTKIGSCTNPNTKEATCTYTADAKVTVTVLNDQACASCDTSQLLTAIKRLFKNTDVRQVDISSPEGKELIKTYKVTVVPAYLLDANVINSFSWTANPQLASAFEKIEDTYKIKDAATGASHYVDENIRKEFLASIGVTPGDNTPQIDFFVMSYCPYGNQAEEAIEPVYQSLKGKADFIPHYVWYGNYKGGGSTYCIDKDSTYCSMHGIQEAHQDIRELCVARDYGMDSWFSFAIAMNKQCTSQNADSCWENVAKSLKLDTTKIKKCQDTDGISLAQKDKALGDKLGVQGSPDIFIEGEGFSGARTAAGYQTALCKAFDTAPAECAQALQEPASAAAVPSQGGCG